MQITIEIPEEIGNQLQQNWQDLPQKTLEALVLEAYRSGIITCALVQQLLKFSSRWETELFLKQSQAYLDYTETESGFIEMIVIADTSPICYLVLLQQEGSCYNGGKGRNALLHLDTLYVKTAKNLHNQTN